MTKKIAVLLLIVFSMSLLLFGCGGQSGEPAKPGEAEKPKTQNWAMPSCSTGSAPYILGGVISQFINEKTDLVEIFPQNASGYKEDMIILNSGSAMMALSTIGDLNMGYNGGGEYTEPLKNVTGMFNYRTTALNIVTTEDKGIKKVEDLKGKRVQVGNVGTMTYRVCQQVLAAYGIDIEKDIKPIRVATGEAIQQLKDGQMDAALIFGSNYSGIIELSVSKKAVLLPLSPEKQAAILKAAEGTVPMTIPAGTYQGVDYDVLTIGTTGTLAAHKDADPKIIYEITKLMFENLPRLQELHSDFKTMSLDTALEGMNAPLHPGAEKYFKEIGKIK